MSIFSFSAMYVKGICMWERIEIPNNCWFGDNELEGFQHLWQKLNLFYFRAVIGTLDALSRMAHSEHVKHIVRNTVFNETTHEPLPASTN